jgi:predicted DNA-binding protein (UPF0251 family)
MLGLETVTIPLDEFEALRFCDYDGLEQEEAGRRMGVSRGTIQRLLYSARRRLIEAILGNKAILINLREGNDCYVCMHTHKRRRRPR